MNNLEEKKKTLVDERNGILSKMILLNKEELDRLQAIEFELQELSELEKESAK